MVFAAEELELITGGADGTFLVWQMPSLELKQRFTRLQTSPLVSWRPATRPCRCLNSSSFFLSYIAWEGQSGSRSSVRKIDQCTVGLVSKLGVV